MTRRWIAYGALTALAALPIGGEARALTRLPSVAALVCDITAVVAYRLRATSRRATSRRPSRSYAVIPHPSRSSVRRADQRSSPRLGATGLRTPTTQQAARRYRWRRRREGYESLAARVAPPTGFTRVAANDKSYAAWLRHLPLLSPGSPVRSYRGRQILSPGHPALLAVVDLDVGKRDRQQCMDTIMRLRGEYLFARGRADRAAFGWAGGRRFGYKHWRRGLRPIKRGRRWRFEKTRRLWSGYRSFRRYLDYMFSWTGTIHQGGERKVKPSAARAGDFFIQAGSPGHAVIVLDIAVNANSQRVALIGQGFMPAQDLHVLRGPRAGWFPLDPPKAVVTPLWLRPFAWSELRRFRS